MSEKTTFLLEILTPIGKKFSDEVSFLSAQSPDCLYGITPNHSPLVAPLVISPLRIRKGEEESVYAIGGGLLEVKKDKVVLLLDSIERSDEIDVERALQAKKRAEERLSGPVGEDIDQKRAKLALARALNRLKVISEK